MRKLEVVFLVIRNVRNWLPLLLARAGFGPFPPRILLRNGLGITMPATDGGGWGEVFEPLIADVYRSPCGFRGLIVDIGANAGAFTLLAVRRNPEATVFACSTEEAFQETYFRAVRGDPKAFSVRA